MSHDQETTIADVLRGRMATYQFLSRLFRVEVDQELYDTLVSMRFPTNTGNALVDEGYRMICGYLSQADGTVLTELAVDYVRAFIGSGNDGFSAAYPYEAVYTSPKRLMMQDARDEVLVLYRAFGLDKQESWKEGEDHIALELEFEQILCAVSYTHLHLVGAQVGCAGVRILGVVVDQLVHLGELPAVAGVLHLGVPPRVLEVDDVFLHAVVQVGHFADLAPLGFDPHPVALLDAVLGGRLRVDLHARHGPQLAAPGKLAMLGVEVHRDATAGGGGQRVFLDAVAILRAVGRLGVGGKLSLIHI